MYGVLENLFAVRDPPGYRQLPWRTRCLLNTAALLLFIRSGDCFRVVAAVLIWWLAGSALAWFFDLRATLALLPELTACPWALVWLRTLRRRYLQAQLRGHWPAR